MQPLPVVLALLVSLAAASSAEVCQSVTFRITKKEKCIEYARVANPAAFVQFPNATCYFHNVCSNSTSRKTVNSNRKSFAPCVFLTKKTVSFHQTRAEITTDSVDIPITKQCPKFEKIGTKKKVLLLRTHASFGQSPYSLLRDGATSPMQMSVVEANKNRKKSFKSPLFTMIDLGSLSEVHIEMLDEKGQAKARLGFAFRPQDKMREGRWFAKDRLISSWPWRLKRLTQHRKYEVFSIHGAARRGARAVRRFYISFIGGHCGRDQGIMAIVEKASCPWEQQNKYFPAYLHSQYKMVWRRGKKEAAEFRIYGVFNQKVELYTRRSQKC